MQFDKVLIAYDGSEGAKNAVKYALKIIEDAPEVKLIAYASLVGPSNLEKLLGTGREGTGFVDDNTRTHYEEVRSKTYNAAMERLQEQIAEIAGDQIGSFECIVEFHSSPVRGILQAAEKFEVDSIIMGCRGVSAIAGILGSVSFGVIRSAEIPVTVVK